VIASVLGRLALAADLGDARARYAHWADQLVTRAYDNEGGIDANPGVAKQIQFLLDDIAAACPQLPPERRGWTAWRAAWVFERLGQPEQANQSIALAEKTARETEDQRLLSRVHYQQAVLLVTRGDLDGAVRLYEQSLAIKEGLGDVRGKSATLAMMAQLQFMRGEYNRALSSARESWYLLQSIGAAPDAAKVAQIIQQMETVLADSVPELTLIDAVAQWRDSDRGEEQLASLLNLICNRYVQTMRDGSEAQCNQLAADLAQLRAIRPLPIAGANDFLGVLQLRLRGEPGMAERAAQIQAALPAQLAQALVQMEQQLSEEPAAALEDSDKLEVVTEMEAMLSRLSPEQQAEIHVFAQVVPLLQQGVHLLQQPDITAAERGRLAHGLESAAVQAEDGETDGSPWLEAAVVLRHIAGWLKDAPADPGTLNELYRSLVSRMLKDTGQTVATPTSGRATKSYSVVARLSTVATTR
jgi:tetratricopeptide (TPR) repeat protein